MVATGAYLAAVFLVYDARRAGDELQRYFSRRAMAAAVVAGVLAVVGLIVLRDEARTLFDDLASVTVIVFRTRGIAGAGASWHARGPAARRWQSARWARSSGAGEWRRAPRLDRVPTIDQAAAPSATLASLMLDCALLRCSSSPRWALL